MNYLILFLFSNLGFGNHAQVMSKQDLWLHGKVVYEKNCLGCHGQSGDGNGPAAAMLNPKPRNFTTGVFKFKSTPWEAVPTDSDLMKTINQGLYGTSMPAFSILPEASKMGVIEYIKSFAPKMWNNPENQQPTVALNLIDPKDFQTHKTFIEKATRGKNVYVENCMICHGVKGHGDGEGSVGLEDEWGQPIVPANLTKIRVKSGASVQDIVKVVVIGIPGTPMPSFKDTITPEAASDVAAYILYLRGLESGIYKAKYKDSAPIESIPASL